MTESEAPSKPRWSRRRKLLIGVSGALVLGVAMVWAFRAPLLDQFAQDQLASRDVPATYEIDQIGLWSQRLTNVVIGNPKSPDLTARSIEIDLRYGWRGPEIVSIRADGVRLRGTVRDGMVSFGALDKFRDPQSREPFTLPDIDATLSDARLDLGTPWGALKGRIDGRGGLRDGFAGQAAVTAESLAYAPCKLASAALSGPISTAAGQLRIRAQGGAERAQCEGRAILTAPLLSADIGFAPDFQHWDGGVAFTARALEGDGFALATPKIRASFDGDSALTNIRWSLDPAAASLARMITGSISARGLAEFGANGPRFQSDVKLVRAAIDTRIRRSIVLGGAAADDLPVRSLIAALTRQIADAGARFDASFAVVQDDDGAPLLSKLTIRSANGVTIATGPGETVRLAPPGFSGTLNIAGGGLPATRVRGQWDARGGDAMLTMAMMSGQGEQLALAPVRINQMRGGPVRFSTVATLGGPVPGGRVDGLKVPIRGGIGGGVTMVDGGCVPLAWERLSIQGAIFDPARLQLCGPSGVPLFRSGKGGGVARLSVAGGAIKGRADATPLTLLWADAWVQMVGNKAAVNGLTINAGAGDSESRFAIKRLDIDFAGGGLRGAVMGGQGTIGTIPLLMSNATGHWYRASDGINFDGQTDVSDIARPARFQPLHSGTVALRYADGAITGTAGFGEKATGTPVLNVELAHRFDGSVGSATLKVPDLRFGRNFQPRQLTGLALGVVTNVSGKVTGGGRIDWVDGSVTSSGKFATEWSDMAAAFGVVRGLSGEIDFSDLINFKTDAVQSVRLAEVNPGIPVRDGVITYRLIGDNRIAIDAGRWPFAGGELSLDATVLDFGNDVPRRMNFRVKGVSAALFLQEFEFENLAADGTFDGELPLVFDGLGARIENGRLIARAGGGSLAYVGELTNRDLGTMANFAFGALKSLKYESLTINLNGSLTGEMVTDVRFEGISQGEGASRNIITRQIAKLPLVFNVRISAPFRQLISSAKSLYDPTILIEQNLPALRRQQAERRARETEGKASPPAEKGTAVQPGASEDVP